MITVSARATAPSTLPSFDGQTSLAEHPRRAFVEQVMGLPVSVHVRGPQARTPRVARVVADLFTTLRADDALFSTWRPHSPISRIQRGELTLDQAPPRVREAAARCEEAGRRTEGAFSAWWRRTDGRRVFDPTGLVKGWAVEQAFRSLIDRLASCGPHDALVCAGGDIAVACARTDTPDWVVGSQDPLDRRRTLRSIPLRTGAVATSGTAARGHHIVDPATGTPAAGLLSATIVGPSLIWADVYATAAFVRGAQADSWIATIPDHAALLVGTDGSIRTVVPAAGRAAA